MDSSQLKLNDSSQKSEKITSFDLFEKILATNPSDINLQDFISLCRDILIHEDIQDLRQAINQISKVNLSIHADLLAKFVTVSISLYKEERINYHKILVLFKSILELNFVDHRLIVSLFDNTLMWLVENFEQSLCNAYFELIFNLMNYSIQGKAHILNSFPYSLNKIAIYSEDKLGDKAPDIQSFFIDYIRNESHKDSISSKQLGNFIRILIKFFAAQSETIETHEIFWFLVGKLLSTYEIGIYSQDHSDFDQLDIFNDFAGLPDILYRIIHSQPENTPSGIIARILFAFSGMVGNKFGFQHMFDILAFWYEREENVNFRYGFHLTYLHLISGRQNPEMTLNFCSYIIFKEHDPDLLTKVVFNLYDLGIDWKLLYPFVILPLLHNNDVRDLTFQDKLSGIYNIYFDDLQKSANGKLISKTEDLFLTFWTVSNKKQKKELIIPLKKWINSSEKTNTIKGIFIKSLILRTKEPYWISILNNFYTSLGKMSVEILDDKEFYYTGIEVSDEQSYLGHFKHPSSTLDSILRNDYCMGCKTKLSQAKGVICDVCKFSFCSECRETADTIANATGEIICLGSALSGYKHNFKELSFE